ncbi:uncharacterized protein LOC144903412 [Branchiostoma floridae x Branchiostoma belcheri]
MDLIIRRTVQADFPDNKPEYSFDEEVLKWISRNCPDWNKVDIRKTYMIPPTFPDLIKKKDKRGQLAEKDVFDILEEFGDKTGQPMFVVHSHEFLECMLNFKNGILNLDLWHGETDFVILHRTLGVIFFQVKAAIKTAHKYGDAKMQLDKDWMAMTRSLKRLCLEDRLRTTVEAELKMCQGFVVMPNCPRDSAQGKDGCFKEDIQSVADFEEWWQKNVHRTGVGKFSKDMYELMALRFVGARVITESCLLKDVIDKTHKRIVILWTMDQLSIMTQSVPKQYIMGPAGSGKTLLLLKKAKEVAGNLKANERILIMCFNRPLKLYLDAEFQDFQQVDVQTFVSILMKIKGPDWEGLPVNDHQKSKLVFDCFQKLSNSYMRKRYQHVFVDEGQDMYGTWVDLVNLLHDDVVGSNEERRYRWVFFDNNQSVHFGSQNYIPQEAIDNAKQMNRIVRNTVNIFECSRKFLSPDVQRATELDHTIFGKQVKWIESLPTSADHISPSDVLKKAAELVIQEIADLDSKSVERSDIVVLTKDVKERDEVHKIFKNGYNIPTHDAEDAILSQNKPAITVAEDAILSQNKPAITVDSIRRFKGLEKKVVILFDPPIDEESNIMMDLNYVAMSRCFCYLVIVTSQEKKQKFVEKSARQEPLIRKRKQKSEKFSPKNLRKV